MSIISLRFSCIISPSDMDVKLFLGIAEVRQSGDLGSATVLVAVAHLTPLRSVFVTVIFGICIPVFDDVVCSFAGECEWVAIALQLN